MKSTVEQLSPTRVKINVEVPFDELKPNFDAAYQKLAKQVRIPGFRPGKAPARVLESRIGRAPVLDEVINEAIPAKYMEAVDAEEVRTLGRPDIEVTDISDGEQVAFTAEVDVRPQITLPAFGEIAVSVDDVEVTEDQVQNQLDELRARFGTLNTAARPARDGDFVSIDLSATVDGEEVPDAATSGLSYQIGSGELVDGIDEAIVGAEAGDTRTFTTRLVAGDYANRDAEVTVTVQSVKERELPEPDDEFAQLASEFDTMDELRESLRDRAANMNRMQQAVQARDKVLDSLLDTVEVELPQSVVDSEVEMRKHDAVHAFDHSDEALDEYLQSEGKTREEFDAETLAEAQKAVRTQLILDTVADEEQVEVDESELSERIVYQAQRFGVSPEEYVQRAQQSGQLGAIFADVRRGKALSGVLRRATVTDGSGNTLDLDELFGGANDAAEAESGTVIEGDAVDAGSGGDSAGAPDAGAADADAADESSEADSKA